MSEKSATHSAALALVLGILSIVGLGALAGIPAWILGKTELGRIDAGQAPAAGRGVAQAGMILGIISTVLTGVAIVAGLLLVLALQPLVDQIQQLSGSPR